MTVQGLIDELQKIEDKSLVVGFWVGCCNDYYESVAGIEAYDLKGQMPGSSQDRFGETGVKLWPENNQEAEFFARRGL